MLKRLEALADAIARYTGWYDPESPVYQNRNPLALKAHSPQHPRDINGLRQFQSVLDGYQAGLFDLSIKCSGKSRTRLKPESTLLDLMLAYGHPATMADYVAKYLKRALQDSTISKTTQLSYFLEQ